MKKEKVLLVDDVAPFLEMEKTFFDGGRFEILTASSGLDAVRVVSRQPPSIIFMDLHMPDMNGDEACSLIKSDSHLCHIPIIMVTHPDEEDIAKCHSSGCDGYLYKPVKRADFLEAVDRFVDKARKDSSRHRARLQIRFGTEGNDQLLTRYSINLSTGGVFLETEEVLPEDTPLMLYLTIPGKGQSLSCRGRVAWVNPVDDKTNPSLPTGMGIQFVGLQPEEVTAIRQYLKQAIQVDNPSLQNVEGQKSHPLAG